MAAHQGPGILANGRALGPVESLPAARLLSSPRSGDVSSRYRGRRLCRPAIAPDDRLDRASEGQILRSRTEQSCFIFATERSGSSRERETWKQAAVEVIRAGSALWSLECPWFRVRALVGDEELSAHHAVCSCERNGDSALQPDRSEPELQCGRNAFCCNTDRTRLLLLSN